MSESREARTVLLVDDDPAIRLLMKRALRGSDFTLIEAENGEQALQQFETHLPDLVLLDVTMPVMDGFECCERIRRHPASSQCAIVMVTAMEQPRDIERALEVGATDFMTKPLKWPLFTHRVHYILNANETLKALGRNQSKLEKAQSIAHLGYWEWDFHSPGIECSAELYRMLGLPTGSKRINYARVLHLVHPEDRSRLMLAVRNLVRGGQRYDLEYRLLGLDGRVVNVHDRAEVIDSFGDRRMTGTLHDITRHKRSEQEAAYYAHYDSLTALPNRRLFIEQLEAALAHADRQGESLSLLFIDLDRFKQINDSYGHHVGDELLCAAAERIRQSVRAFDVVAAGKEDLSNIARLAGDEFTVLLPDAKSPEMVAGIVQRMLDAFAEPFELKGHRAYVTVSIGVACYPGDGVNSQTLLQHADMAMNHAKQAGRNTFRFFSTSMNQCQREQLELQNDMHAALENGEFELYYQAQVDAHSKSANGFEALLRWNHPTRGLLTPYTFMDIAESTGLILRIGAWVLLEACHQARAWQNEYQREVRMAVNLSALQFNDTRLAGQIEHALLESGLSPHLLELEITESAIITNMAETNYVLFGLKRLGVKLAIDDFGTGYSSLNYLRNFPIDTLKIDKSFVDYIDRNDKDAAIARTIVQLAENLGLSTVAEGVETLSQQQVLEGMGCQELQGYLYSKPITATEVENRYFK
ncbi:putative bifunctional diguanylate cyclase/phosphodiesterase [Oceanisphaera psychrotolerans]|uniref:Two-component system response regulator n=1 Tax=Oceanisphaera psychrotolerans TaxID=1414654 RepID=A0A1J4QJ52_9GAMM|nr:EAL domain-containing protein [Oceanisphaera psychrotolerans]OIN12738.1 two-component system response regulator [Oceanisphaera psychrotolerans]